MQRGAFQTSREIFNNAIWSDIPKFRIFFFIVGNAVFAKDGIKHAGMKLKRGQFLRSYRNLRDDLEYIENRSIKKYSISMINRKISSLIDEERLEKEETELGTLFTVVNYEQYQVLDNYKKGNLERTENSDGTEMEQHRNNNKNVKNDKNVKNEEKEISRKQKPLYDNSHYKLSELLYNNILENNPNHRKPNLDNWSNDIRKIIELDGRSHEQVEYLINWVQKDDFWCSNVLSPSKLRKQFDQLVIIVKKEKEPKTKANNNITDFDALRKGSGNDEGRSNRHIGSNTKELY